MSGARVTELRRRGSLGAQRALRTLEIDVERPVDVFGSIERQQVWLMFQPLDRLYGAYDRGADAAGIVIHSGHPLRTQRFTGAHELGHHLLGHLSSVDSQDEVEATTSNLPEQEIEAQAFAATFLMPVQLVNRALSRVGIPRTPNSITPELAYRVSLELGSSYTATVTQLRALDRISSINARELLKARPIAIKTDLALGEGPADSRADVWPLTLADSGRELWIRTGDELHARLPESPTTGYRWGPAHAGDQLQLIGDQPIKTPDERSYGATRERHVWWRAPEPAETDLDWQLRRRFEGNAGQAAESFRLTVHVVPPPTGASEHGLSERQRRHLC